MESATSALGQHAGSSWDSPMASRAGRAEALKSRAKMEASRQKALMRSEERRANEARSSRKLRFAEQEASTEEHKAIESRPPGAVLPPEAGNGSPPAEANVPAAPSVERLSALEHDVSDLHRRMENIHFNVAGIQQDFRNNQGSQQQFQDKMLAYFEGAGPPAGQPAKLSAGAKGPAPTSRLDNLQRNRDEGKQLITDEEFDIVRRVLGQTGAQVRAPSPLLPLCTGLSSKGFGSFDTDFPTSSGSNDVFSSVRMDQIRAMQTNKSKLVKVFSTEVSFFEHFAEKGFLHRDHEHFLFFSTLLFQTRELVMRDGSWATSKAYLIKLWTTQANDGRPWLKLLNSTSSKRYIDTILPEFKGHIEYVRFDLLREELKSAKTPKAPRDHKNPPGKAKETGKFDYFCEWHNSWFPKASHTGTNECKKTGKQRLGSRNGP